jgi:tetratricopeptide (TPR) repeat protein
VGTELKTIRPFFLLLFVLPPLLAAPGGLRAQSTFNPNSQLLFPLADQGIGARAIGMGSAFVAVGGDLSALDWNPAGLASLPSAQLALDHDFYLQDLTQDILAFAQPEGWGGWGLSLGYLSDGTLVGRDANGVSTGNLSGGRFSGKAAVACLLLPGFSAGAGVEWNHEVIPGSGNSFDTIAGNLGVDWNPLDNLSLGLSYLNFGTGEGYYIADCVFRGGALYRLKGWEGQDILFAAAASVEPYGVDRLQAGVEDRIASVLALRAGYDDTLTGAPWQSPAGWSAGLGVILSDLSFDYAYEPYGGLGDSHWVSCTYRFPGLAPPPARNATPAATPKPSPAVPVTVFVKPTPAATPLPSPTEAPQEARNLKLVFTLPEETPLPGPPDAAWNQKLETLQGAVAQDPQKAAAWYQLGLLYYQADRKAEAVQSFEQVLRLNPKNAALQKWLENYKNAPGAPNPSPAATPSSGSQE